MKTKTRILCLHGRGDNARIFRAQTALLRKLLPKTYEFVFVEGEELCDPLPDVGHVDPGPYRCWYSSPSTERVAMAHDIVQRAIDRGGPFDVVMGFSQGASLAASIILHHQLENPSSPPLFRAAVFFSAPLPFSTSLTYGIDSRTYFAIPYPRPLLPMRPTSIPGYLIPKDATYLQPDDGEVFYQMFHYTADAVRIEIPTAHVYGRWDKLWRTHARDLVHMCGDEKGAGVFVYEHDGAHEIPRDEMEEICDVVEMAIAEAGLM